MKNSTNFLKNTDFKGWEVWIGAGKNVWWFIKEKRC